MSEFQTIIEAAELQANLVNPGWVVIDCRFALDDTEAGRRAYREGHIAGAHYAHLDEDLSGPGGLNGGRHPLPDPGVFADKLSVWGVSNATQLIAYDDSGGAYAARLWWLLKWLGHEKVAVLNGGFSAWKAAGG
ncbi:MAG: sulfurtransferase, partial [Gammaproteobacteria bacterium]|nr:sulfurtransferase [Gammaproteobacteria bacterium]